ncbi:ABC transporter permease [Nocardia flavorosea]|uniref:DUF6297 family protein n=1 Tax=Nocardia flavorosea TaxID=53429 RepID=UPI001892FEB8|nr:DUF6297 family protein [Nocardia flavorosea]MBF6351462.1 ABC transporter permease [Nocardia flavorosea]
MGTVVQLVLGAYVVGGVVWWAATRPATFVGSVLFTAESGWTAGAWALFAAAVSGGLLLARAFGPVGASAPDALWLLSTPVDRGALLRVRAGAALAVGAAGGTAVGRLTAYIAGANQWGPLTVLGLLAGVVVVAVAVLVQSRRLPGPVLPLLCRLFASAGLGLTVAATVQWTVPALTTWPVVLVAAVPAAGLAIWAAASCRHLSRADLAAGSDLTSGAQTALTSLDPSVLAGILEERAWRRVGRSPTRRLPAGRTAALLRADLLRHRRRPSAYAVTAAVVAAVWFATGIGTPLLVAFTGLGGSFWIAMLFSAGLRDICGDPALCALLGAGDGALRWPMLIVPAAALGLTAVLTVLATGPAVAAISTIAAALAAYRIRIRSALSYEGLLLITSAGPLPVDLIRQLIRGLPILAVAGVLLVWVI